jgi:predicted ATPase
MNLRKENCYVITGGPGVGKTTLLSELSKNKVKTVSENARQIIKEQVKKNGDGVPWKNRELYVHLVLHASLVSFNAAPTNSADIYFFDRGILDIICYADMIGLGISEEMDNVGENCRYNRKVFILPPWLEIYHTDNERKQTWEEAILTFKKMKEIYLKYDYEIIEVPKDSVENRMKFILDTIKNCNP